MNTCLGTETFVEVAVFMLNHVRAISYPCINKRCSLELERFVIASNSDTSEFLVLISDQGIM